MTNNAERVYVTTVLQATRGDGYQQTPNILPAWVQVAAIVSQYADLAAPCTVIDTLSVSFQLPGTDVEEEGHIVPQHGYALQLDEDGYHLYHNGVMLLTYSGTRGEQVIIAGDKEYQLDLDAD